MKTLSLYIDRWYITAAINSSGILRHVEYPNREDRIWLYFYQDLINDKVIYGRNFRRNYLDKEQGYIGDIFEKIVSNYATFTRFGIDQSIKDIFKASGIVEHLQKEFRDDEKKIVFLSFSLDVSYAAQKVFIEILQSNDFEVKESVARISHLALEYSEKKGNIINPNNILTISAYNENLNYCIYKCNKEKYIRRGDDSILKGYGTDLRGRALLEQIVRLVNQSSRFLSKEEEEYEINRLSQDLDMYLSMFDKSKFGFPVVYSDITFSRAPYNKQSVSILKNVIEERTKAIVESVIDKIISYMRKLEVGNSDLTHVVFLGNSFKNPMFKEALLKKIVINENAIIHYPDSELPEIVSIYNQIDLDQFEFDRKDIENMSLEELEDFRLAEEEKKKREEADKVQSERNKAFEAEKEALKKFDEIMSQVDSLLKTGDYGRTIDLLRIALIQKPDDREAMELLEEVTRKYSELKVINEKYNKAIVSAEELFIKEIWSEALAKCQIALDLRPESKEALKIKQATEKKIKLAESVREFLLRADTFISQKLYNEALIELNKAKHADANNVEITSRILKIEKEENERLSEIQRIEQDLELRMSQENYDKAIQLCDTLSEIDSSNQKKWSDKKLCLINEYNQKKEAQLKLLKLRDKINDATFNEEWGALVDLCNQFLNIENDERVRMLLEKASAKNNEIARKKEFESRISYIKALIVDKHWIEAKENTKNLERDYQECKSTTKQLFKQIFEAEELSSRGEPMVSKDEVGSKSQTSTRIPIGFSPTVNSDKNKNDDFFGEEHIQKNKFKDPGSKPKDSSVGTKHNNNNKDFFDHHDQGYKKVNINDHHDVITNDDFEF